jgi:hypothetical protein
MVIVSNIVIAICMIQVKPNIQESLSQTIMIMYHHRYSRVKLYTNRSVLYSTGFVFLISLYSLINVLHNAVPFVTMEQKKKVAVET